MPKLVLAGGSGFVGAAIIERFSDWEVVVLGRRGTDVPGARGVKWDAATIGSWTSELENVDAVINLAGEPIAQRWTEESKRRILESRTRSTCVIGEAIQQLSTPPKVWVNASAVGYYGDTGDTEVDETSAPGRGFLAETCLAWEDSQRSWSLPGTRCVRVRIGVAFGKDGGALPVLAKLTRSFLGGAAGNGRQFVPWIHVDDLARLFRWCVESPVEGPVNGCAPLPIRNAELMEALRKTIGRPWAPPAPTPLLKVATGLMGLPAETVLISSRVVPRVAQQHGFAFQHADLERALRDLLR